MPVRLDPRPSIALEDWQRSAACRDRPDLMDPPEDERTVWAENAALALCRRCPALTPCRTWVLGLRSREDPGGIAGGLTERDRETARRRRGQKRAAELAPVIEDSGSKACLDCERDLPAAEFHVDRARSDGRSIYCRDCKQHRNRVTWRRRERR